MAVKPALALWFILLLYFMTIQHGKWIIPSYKRTERMVYKGLDSRSQEDDTVWTVLQKQERNVHWLQGGPAPCDKNEMSTSKLVYKCNLLYHWFSSLFKSWDRNNKSFIFTPWDMISWQCLVRSTHLNGLIKKACYRHNLKTINLRCAMKQPCDHAS